MDSAKAKKVRVSRVIEVALAVGSATVGLAAFLVGDYIYSLHRAGDPFALPKPKTNGKSLYISKPNGWYELNKEYSGEDQYGRYIFKVRTDSNGFRVPISAEENASNRPKSKHTSLAPPLLFLGDSFTYGVASSWEDSFVGQVAKRYSGQVFNAGVNSHSPTPYLYRLSRMIRDGSIPSNTIIIMAIDISDVQDEATRWIKTDSEPTERTSLTASQVVQRSKNTQTAQSAKPFFSPTSFQLTHQIYYGLEALFKRFFDHLQVRNLSRSAFTHKPWSEIDSRYQPLGVKGGLDQIRDRIREAAQISYNSGHEFWLLIYPWPAQLAYQSSFSWEDFIAQGCEPPSCRGVINTIPSFRDFVGDNQSSRSWQERFYLMGDMHFTSAGNKVIADNILKALLKPRSHDSIQ